MLGPSLILDVPLHIVEVDLAPSGNQEGTLFALK